MFNLYALSLYRMNFNYKNFPSLARFYEKARQILLHLTQISFTLGYRRGAIPNNSIYHCQLK